MSERKADIAIVGTMAYVAAKSDVSIVDLSVPEEPVVVGSVAVEGQARRIVVSGNHAYGAAVSGVHVVDISDPTSPTLAATYNQPTGEAYDVAVSGSTLYVAVFAWAATSAGLEVLDISNPASPSLVTKVSCQPRVVSVSANNLLVVEHSGDLRLYDISGEVPGGYSPKLTPSVRAAITAALFGSTCFTLSMASRIGTARISGGS